VTHTYFTKETSCLFCAISGLLIYHFLEREMSLQKYIAGRKKFRLVCQILICFHLCYFIKGLCKMMYETFNSLRDIPECGGRLAVHGLDDIS
jgi:hypothetical protein